MTPIDPILRYEERYGDRGGEARGYRVEGDWWREGKRRREKTS